MKYLLDTNVVSALRRAERHPPLLAWIMGVPNDNLYLSVIGLGEIRRGIEIVRPRDPSFATELDGWLRQLQSQFADRILPIDQPIGEAWGRMLASDREHAIDTLLAATALVHGMSVATRNTKHFQARGVPVIDPFQPARH